ncbi:CxC2 domain-containing protein [Favolaschia claudopus]|uniref:CxC2 domain-containing protein n=1 Tax=Favolaschia claudopus TaxID=2862362 RepID=A0AAW0B0T8_9AGAR
MSFFTSSPARAANRSTRVDSFVDYEARPDDITMDTTYSSSQDGRRSVRSAVNISPRKRRLLPSELDDLSQWTPLADESGGVDGTEAEGSSTETGSKRKWYDSSDDPMKLWRPMLGFFLDEMLRHEGLGGARSACAQCTKPLVVASRRFRCRQCGTFLQCRSCVLERHQEWKGCYWTTVTLSSLDLVYQLGHGGWPCPHPAPATRSMVVLDFPHIHEVKFRYCACDLSDRANNFEQLLRNAWYPATTVDPGTCATFATLEVFRLLTVIGALSVLDFVGTMEKSTNPSGVDSVPDRYRAFGRMSRQFSFLGRLKRSGRAHNPGGVESTGKGECAVRCWACPQEGVNLPEGWKDVAPEFQFLFMLILAVDANFRMRNRLRANAHYDPPLGSGWGYMQEANAYKRFLLNATPEKDISTCVAFAALAQKETRLTTGLRASGLGGVVCARHELIRPQGLGDLQKGERYSNMDYIVVAAVLGIALLYLAICYDIVCQWKIKFRERMAAMPENMRLDLNKTTVVFGLPVWHATAHERKCQVQNSLTYQEGVGRTDGEGTERVWSVMTGMAAATKEMNWGAREDHIEDKVDYHNNQKNLRHGSTLARKLVIAIDERDRQIAGFEDVDRTLKPELRAEWQGMIDAWVANKDEKNPYQLDASENVTSEASIRRTLAKEELDEVATGKTTLHGSSVTSFLVMGLQLEAAQDRIRRESKARPLLPGEQNELVSGLRRGFFVKLRKFRRLQGIYMPAGVEEANDAEEKRDAELPPPQAEEVKLYLPSGVRKENQRRDAEELAEKEARLRDGQLHDNIRRLRSALHAKRHLIHFREEHMVGQRGGTRAAALMVHVSTTIETIAGRYRRARQALVALRGEEGCPEWRALEDDDIRLDQEREADAVARERLGGAGSGNRKSVRGKMAAISSKNRKMSWIWTQGGGPDDDEQELVDAVRVEWCMAKARRDRWVEEVSLLREEMRRVIRFLNWQALWWEERRTMTREVMPEIKEGVQAYAARQAVISRQIARQFKREWGTSVSAAVRIALDTDAALGLESMGEELMGEELMGEAESGGQLGGTDIPPVLGDDPFV